MLRSDEDSALPQGQEELYLLHLGGGGQAWSPGAHPLPCPPSHTFSGLQ